MSFGNGLNKQLRRGKSIADHMRDAIAQAMSVFEATEYVRRKCCCARVSKKRLHELYASLLPDCTAGAEDCGGCGQLGERM